MALNPFERFGRALGELWESIKDSLGDTSPEQDPDWPRPDPKRPLPPRPPGVPAPVRRGNEPPAEPPGKPRFDIDPFDHGPYRKGWGRCEREFWDSEPQTYRAMYTDAEWKELQESFHFGWIFGGKNVPAGAHRMTRAEHEEWRERFYVMSNTSPASFDWGAFREYLQCIGSPGV